MVKYVGVWNGKAVQAFVSMIMIWRHVDEAELFAIIHMAK